MSEEAGSRLKHRLAGFASVDIPEGPRSYELGGRALKGLAATVLALGLVAGVLLLLFFSLVMLAMVVVWVIAGTVTFGWFWQAMPGFPLGEFSFVIPAVLAPVLGGIVLAVMLNHAVIWWARRDTKGLWAGGLAGVTALSAGGAWLVGALLDAQSSIGTLEVVPLGLVALGTVLLWATLSEPTRRAFRTSSEAVFEPVGEA